MFAVVLTNNAQPSTLYDSVLNFFIIFQSPGYVLPRTLRFSRFSVPLRVSRTQVPNCLSFMLSLLRPFLLSFTSMPLPPMAVVVSVGR